MILHLALFGFALLIAKVFDADRRIYWIIAIAALALLIMRWALREGTAYALDAGASLRFLGWSLLVAMPVGGYVYLIRALRRRSGVGPGGIQGDGGGSPVRRGLVSIPEDAALRSDTLAELGLEAVSKARGSFAWREEDGGISGHLAWTVQSTSLEIEIFNVKPGSADIDVAEKLLEAVEDHARDLKLNKIVTIIGNGQVTVDFNGFGFRQVARLDLGNGVERIWMEKELA